MDLKDAAVGGGKEEVKVKQVKTGKAAVRRGAAARDRN